MTPLHGVPLTLGDALAVARGRIDRLDARLLLQYASGCTHADLLARPETPVIGPVAEQYLDWLARRAAGEPLAYLVGEAEFRGRVFQVSPDVLIPRPETEILVELAVDRIKTQKSLRVLDLGTGSGIVAISLALACPQAEVLAVDLSPAALAVARNNAGRLGAAVHFVESDWFSALAGERFDLIVSNPPYIAEGDPHLAGDGLPFEPAMALSDGEAGGNGLACIRRIVADAPGHLTPAGWLLFEHGYDQGAASRNLLQRAGFQGAFTHPDLAGIDRVSGGHL